MSDRYQQLVNTPIGKIVSKQIGLPAPLKLERFEPGQPVVDGPVLLGAAPGGRLARAVANVLADIEAEVHTPLEGDVRTAAADAGLDARIGIPTRPPRTRRSRRWCSTPAESWTAPSFARRMRSSITRSVASGPRGG